MSFEQRNREYFDKLADSYDAEPWQKKIITNVTAEVHSSLDWIGADWVTSANTNSQTRLLDYACGPGTIATALAPYVTQTRGIDLSSAMVDRFNRLAAESGLPHEQTHAVVGNLRNEGTQEAISGADFFDFDVAAIGLGFHHFEQRPLMLKRIAERLKPGGVLLIIDFLVDTPPTEDEKDRWSADSKHTIAIHGFTRQDMQELYDQAGLVDFALKTFSEPLLMPSGSKKTGFLAKGRKV